MEAFASLPFAVYGLVGELGVPGGFGSGFAGVTSSLQVAFGGEDEERRVTVTSSREADLDLARMNTMNAVSELMQPTDGPTDDSPASFEAWVEAERERHREVRRELRERPWRQVVIPVDGAPVEWWSTRSGDLWVAITRIDFTTITLVGRGYEPGEVALERITDLAPYAEHAQRQHRKQIERHLQTLGRDWPVTRPQRSAEEREWRGAVRAVADGLTGAMHRNAGAPELADLFTDRVHAGWGGRDRYQRLLWLHTMLRPITGSGSTGDYPVLNADGSADMRISLNHAPTRRQHGSAGMRFAVLRATTVGEPLEPEPEPDRDAINRGEEHHVTLRLIAINGEWLIDTDLLAILIDRLGAIDHVAQPLSRQG